MIMYTGGPGTTKAVGGAGDIPAMRACIAWILARDAWVHGADQN